MITDLFTATSGLDDATVARVIPPACRREVALSPVVTVREGALLIELPEWRPRVPSRHLVPSLSVLTDVPYAARFELSAWTDGMWSPWIATATIGQERSLTASRPRSAHGGLIHMGAPKWPPNPPTLGVPRLSRGTPRSPSSALVCDVDEYSASVPLERLKLRIRVGAADVRTLATAAWMATLSACDLGPRASDTTAMPTPRLLVPALSQMDAPAEIALRICSPTSVAMVLAYWGVPTPLLPLAADVFHAESDRYGVWPAAIHAAGRRGVAGYLLRFPDWSSAAWCLERKLPIIASIRYAAGELTHAAIPETSGHLIVLTGLDGDHVFVNDPAAPTATTVPRRYRFDELQRAWLNHTGIGYVLFRPDHLTALGWPTFEQAAGAIDFEERPGFSRAAPSAGGGFAQ